MKKLLFALATGGLLLSAQAQQRVQIFEEFTGENCPPCASTNPALHALIDQNVSDVILISYQVNIPTAGPLYNQYPNDPTTRRQYYSSSSAPNGRHDGAIFAQSTNAPGHPGYFDQSMITARKAVASPFDISVTHSLNSTADSIEVNITVTNVSGSTFTSGAAGSLKLHTLLLEKHLNFPEAPGTNGETEFVNVARDMYPSATGAALSDSWNASQSQTFTYKEQLPTYLYDLSQIAVAAFIQDDAANGSYPAKEIHQGAYSSPVSLPAGLVDVSVNNTTQGTDYCTTSATPEVEIKNETSTTINSVDISMLVNNSVVQSQTYTTPIAANATATIAFNPVTLSTGANNVSFIVTAVNGGADYNKLNNIDPGAAINIVSSNVTKYPIVNDFEGTPAYSAPSGFIIEDPTNSIFVLDASGVSGLSTPLGGYLQSTSSVLYYLGNMPSDNVASLVTEKISLAGSQGAELQFDYSYAVRGSVTGEQFNAYISGDCGATWIRVFDGTGGSGLETAPASASNQYFFPTAANHWKTISADISAADGVLEVMFKFEAISKGGNLLFVDNIMVDGKPIGITEVNVAEEAKVYPNPASDKVFVEMAEATDFSVELTNTAGQTVKTADYSNTAKAELNISDLPKGIYILNINSDKGSSSQRITVAD